MTTGGSSCPQRSRLTPISRWLRDLSIPVPIVDRVGFLLGVHDETRLGALRFRDPDSGQFIDSDDQFAAPPITSLRDLQAASLEFEIHADDEEHPDYQLSTMHYQLIGVLCQ